MTGRVIPLQGDWHGDLKKLLPWYATGALSDAEHADMAAHVAGCADCQGELSDEQRLAQLVAAAPATPASDVEAAWAAARKRMLRTPRGARSALGATLATFGASLSAPWRSAAPTVRGVVLAQAAALVLAVGALTWQTQAPRYQALSAPVAVNASTPNLIVKFRPETSEAEMRALLHESDARVVGGPTAADAYLLQTPEPSRGLALAQLRASTDVLLAEPIETGPSP
jgi:anti-sigma-K factor RskA